MQVEAVYHHGTLRFESKLHFHRQHFKVTVDIPESVIAESATEKLPDFDVARFSPAVQAEIGRLEGIRKNALRHPTHSSEEEVEEERTRWKAAALRNESRKEQGRNT